MYGLSLPLKPPPWGWLLCCQTLPYRTGICWVSIVVLIGWGHPLSSLQLLVAPRTSLSSHSAFGVPLNAWLQSARRLLVRIKFWASSQAPRRLKKKQALWSVVELPGLLTVTPLLLGYHSGLCHCMEETDTIYICLEHAMALELLIYFCNLLLKLH